MRKLFFLVLFLLNVYFIFFPSEILAATEEKTEEKLVQIINQRLKQQIERLLAQNRILTEENKILQTELAQITIDRQDLLKKLKDYTLHRRKLDARIRTLEAGIINLNQVKEEFAQTNKTLKKQLTSVKDEREKLKEKLAGHKMNELKDEIEKLKREKQAYIDDNEQFRKRMKIALNELLSNNADLKKLKKELAIVHYNLGVMFYQAGDYKKALKEYQQVLKMKPGDAFSHYNLALIYEEVEKDKEKAIYHYNKYLQFKSSAEDVSQVKEWITEAELEQKIWGE